MCQYRPSSIVPNRRQASGYENTYYKKKKNKIIAFILFAADEYPSTNLTTDTVLRIPFKIANLFESLFSGPRKFSKMKLPRMSIGRRFKIINFGANR